ncbi:hypothetical protein KIH79_11665, partial [Bifidobacterium sp. 82T10]|nr:hypothetical protein [Bifidobacterium miconis]
MNKDVAERNVAVTATVSPDGVVDNTAVRRAWPLPKRLGWHFAHYWQHWVMALPAMVFVFVF